MNVFQLLLTSPATLGLRYAVGTEDNLVSVEMQSEIIDSSEAEMQFANGNDDTDFENLVVQIAKKREQMLEAPGHAFCDASEASDVVEGLEQVTQMNIRRLPAFLRHVTPIIEKYLEQRVTILEHQERPRDPQFLDSVRRCMLVQSIAM